MDSIDTSGFGFPCRIFALLFHTTQFVPIILVGLMAAVREGVTTSQVSELADEEPQGIQ